MKDMKTMMFKQYAVSQQEALCRIYATINIWHNSKGNKYV